MKTKIILSLLVIALGSSCSKQTEEVQITNEEVVLEKSRESNNGDCKTCEANCNGL